MKLPFYQAQQNHSNWATYRDWLMVALGGSALFFILREIREIHRLLEQSLQKQQRTQEQILQTCERVLSRIENSQRAPQEHEVAGAQGSGTKTRPDAKATTGSRRKSGVAGAVGGAPRKSSQARKKSDATSQTNIPSGPDIRLSGGVGE